MPWDAIPVETQRAAQSIWRSEQKEEECSIGLVLGRSSAGFEPCMMAIPSVVRTHHDHFRPRFFKTISKVGNRSVMASGSRGITCITTLTKVNSCFE